MQISQMIALNKSRESEIKIRFFLQQLRFVLCSLFFSCYHYSPSRIPYLVSFPNPIYGKWLGTPLLYFTTFLEEQLSLIRCYPGQPDAAGKIAAVSRSHVLDGSVALKSCLVCIKQAVDECWTFEECELSTSTPCWLLSHILREFFVLFVKAAFSYSYRLCSICHYRGGRNHLCADVTVANEWPSCSLRVCTVSVFGDRDPAVRLCHGLHKSHVKKSNNWLWCTTGGKQMWTVCGGF